MGERPRPLPRRRRYGPPELAPAWQQLETERPPTGSLPAAPRLSRPSYGGLSEDEFRNQAYRDTERELMANELNRPPEMYRGERLLGPFLEMTGAPSLVRSYVRARDGDPWGSAGEAAMGALAIGGVRATMREPIPRPMPAPPPMTQPWPADMFGALPREPMPRPQPRLPGRASDGSILPVAPSRPFTNSLRGGSDDLSEAAGMGRGFERLGPGYSTRQFMRGDPSSDFPDEGVDIRGVRSTEESVQIESLTPTQLQVALDFADPSRLRNGPMIDGSISPFGDMPAIYRNGDDMFVLDGHNRIAEAAARGDTNIRVRVFDARDGARPYLPESSGHMPVTDWTTIDTLGAPGVARQHGLSERQAIDLVRRANRGDSLSDRQRWIIRDMIRAERSGPPTTTDNMSPLQRYLYDRTEPQ